MARPIRETPILEGYDAEIFLKRMQETDNLTEEQRAANRAKLEAELQEALKYIEICI